MNSRKRILKEFNNIKKNINNILLIANQRTHWNPNELIPVGTILRELDGIITYYDTELEKSSRASAPESTRPS